MAWRSQAPHKWPLSRTDKAVNNFFPYSEAEKAILIHRMAPCSGWSPFRRRCLTFFSIRRLRIRRIFLRAWNLLVILRRRLRGCRRGCARGFSGASREAQRKWSLIELNCYRTEAWSFYLFPHTELNFCSIKIGLSHFYESTTHKHSLGLPYSLSPSPSPAPKPFRHQSTTPSPFPSASPSTSYKPYSKS